MENFNTRKSFLLKDSYHNQNCYVKSMSPFAPLSLCVQIIYGKSNK